MLEDLVVSGQKDIQVIIFKLGREEYAVPINYVNEIIMLQKTTRIPKSPHYMAGIINLRGNIIPVIDGKKKFQLQGSLVKDTLDKIITDERIMVLEVENEKIGLLVDGVYEVIRLNLNEIEPPPIDLEDNTAIFCGIGKYNERLLILINCEKFLTIEDEAQVIKTFANVTEVIKQIQTVS